MLAWQEEASPSLKPPTATDVTYYQTRKKPIALKNELEKRVLF